MSREGWLKPSTKYWIALSEWDLKLKLGETTLTPKQAALAKVMGEKNAEEEECEKHHKRNSQRPTFYKNLPSY